MILGFLLKIFGRGTTGSGLFDYLKSRDSNRTDRIIEQERNKAEIEIRKDWNRTLIQLERERRMTARDLIDRLPEGSEYRESTIIGKREIRKVQASPTAFLLLPNDNGEMLQGISYTELTAPQAPALAQQGGPEPSQHYDPDRINQTLEPE